MPLQHRAYAMQGCRAMLQEINLMEKLSFDRNIVQFYGAVLSAPAPMLVLEFMEGMPRQHSCRVSHLSLLSASFGSCRRCALSTGMMVHTITCCGWKSSPCIVT